MSNNTPRCLLLHLFMMLSGLTLSPLHSCRFVAAAEDAPATIDVFEIPKHGDFIVLPVRVGGRRVHFTIGTQCPQTVCDLQLKETFGPETETLQFEGAKGQVDLTFYEAPTIWLGAIPLTTKKPIAAGNLGALRQKTGHPIMGILGMDLLSQLVLQIDFDAGSVSVLPEHYVKEGEPFETYLLADDGTPYVHGTFGDTQLERLALDTMFPGSLSLKPRSVKAAVENRNVDLIGETILSVPRTKTGARCGFAKSFKSSTPNGKCVTHVALPVVEGSTSCIGLEYLSRFVVTIDFPDQTIHFTPGKNFDRRDHPDQSGMLLIKRDGAIFVQRVELDTPADRAEITVGDEVVPDQLAGEPLSLFEVRRLFCVDGKNVTLQIRRDGHVKPHILKLPASTVVGK